MRLTSPSASARRSARSAARRARPVPASSRNESRSGGGRVARSQRGGDVCNCVAPVSISASVTRHGESAASRAADSARPKAPHAKAG
eukprot:250719-Pleurochrysis_carterae.AAC.2